MRPENSGLDFSDEHGQAQLRAVHMLGEGGAYGVLIGRDGAGKSTMLKVMTTVWAEQGREVLRRIAGMGTGRGND